MNSEGLRAREAKRQPAPRAVDLAPQPRDEEQREQPHAEQEQPGRGLLPGVHRHLEREHSADAKERDLQRALAAGLTLVLIVLLFIVAPRMNLGDLSVGAYDSLVRVLAKSRGAVEDETVGQRGPEIHQLLMYDEGPTSTVSVRKDWDITSMAINGRTNASDSEDMATQVMLGQMPLLLAPRLKNALVVGFATGVTAGAILQSPIESVECVELEPATVNGSRFFRTRKPASTKRSTPAPDH